MYRNYALEFVRVTERAAIEGARWFGLGDRDRADEAATAAMHRMLNTIEVDAEVVIGMGDRGEAPVLFSGERVGNGKGVRLDLAVDPIDGSAIVAQGGSNAISVIAVAEEGGFLKVPESYMHKIAVGPQAAGVIDISLTPSENLGRICEAMKRQPNELIVAVLNRPRHADLIDEIRSFGARTRLVTDGDIAAALATSKPGTGIDVMMGTGSAPEGVMAAAALKCLGGDIQCKFAFRTDDERKRATKLGITDFERSYGIHDLAKGDVMFAVTGVTVGPLLEGVHFIEGGARTQSWVMRTESGTRRVIDAEHHFYQSASKPKFY